MCPEMLEKEPSTEYKPQNDLGQHTTEFLKQNQSDLQRGKDIVALGTQGKVRFRQDPDTEEITVFINGKQSMTLYHSENKYYARQKNGNRENPDVAFIENMLNEATVQVTTESPAIKNPEQAKALRNSKKALEHMDAAEGDENTKQFRAAVFLSDIAGMNLVQFLPPTQLPDGVGIIQEVDLNGRAWIQGVDPYSELTVDMGGKQKDYGARGRKNADIPFSWAGDLIQDRQALKNLSQKQKPYIISILETIINSINTRITNTTNEFGELISGKTQLIQEKKADRREKNKGPLKIFAGLQAKQSFNRDKKELLSEIDYLEYIKYQADKVARKLNRA